MSGASLICPSAWVRCRTYRNGSEGEDAREPTAPVEEIVMLKYGVAWLLGVPLGLLVVIYLIFHLL
jgi:hypothetical protein